MSHRRDAVFQCSSHTFLKTPWLWTRTIRSINQRLLSPFFHQRRFLRLFYTPRLLGPTASIMMLTKAIFALYLAVITLAAPPVQRGDHHSTSCSNLCPLNTSPIKSTEIDVDVNALNNAINNNHVDTSPDHSTNRMVYLIYFSTRCSIPHRNVNICVSWNPRQRNSMDHHAR